MPYWFGLSRRSTLFLDWETLETGAFLFFSYSYSASQVFLKLTLMICASMADTSKTPLSLSLPELLAEPTHPGQVASSNLTAGKTRALFIF